MKNRTVIVTGATSGIGKEAAKSLAINGFTVIIPARDLKKANAVKMEIERAANNKVYVFECDLSSKKDILSFAEAFKKQFSQLDVLINNAGVWNNTFLETADGIENTFAVNVIAPFLLMASVKDVLKKSPDPRVITVSSGLHFGNINFEDIEYRSRFSGFQAYRQSKLAVILLTRLLASSLKEDGISINCMHPGLVNTDLGRHGNRLFTAMFKYFGKSAKKGADTLLYMATSDAVAGTSGEYYENRKVKRTTTQSYDLNAAAKLLSIVSAKAGTNIA